MKHNLKRKENETRSAGLDSYKQGSSHNADQADRRQM